MEKDEVAKVRRSLAGKTSLLTKLLKAPLFPKGFSGKFPDSKMKLSLNQESQKAVEAMKEA